MFDSFECTIHAMAPRIFCCARCAKEAGITALADRA
jgi:hypothetical protein